MSSIVDLFYNRKFASKNNNKQDSNNNENYHKAIDLFNSIPKETTASLDRLEGESVLDWERRIRDDELSSKHQRESLYADQYKQAQNINYQENDYIEEAEKTDEFVQSKESHESTGDGNFHQYAQWSQGDVLYEDVASSSENQTHSMEEVEVEKDLVNQLGQHMNVSELLKKSSIEGLSSADWSGAED